MVVVARLDSAGLNSPATAQISPSLPPSFTVSEEQGQLASHGASLDSAGLTEVSFIAPPSGPSAR